MGFQILILEMLIRFIPKYLHILFTLGVGIIGPNLGQDLYFGHHEIYI